MRTCLVTLVAVLTLATVSAAQDTIKLKNGTVYSDAILVKLSPATYILQTPKALLELTDEELAAESARAARNHGRPPVVAHDFNEIHADGTVTSYWTLPLVNNGRKAITETRWGLAPWERSHAEKRHYVDDRGVSLQPEYSPPISRWPDDTKRRIQVTLPLAVPLAPGERTTFTGSETTNWTRRTEEGIVFSHPGDYAEDRLVWRKVQLPLGAHIVRISPRPSARFKHGGHEYVMWRRFYKKGEVYPMEVVYTLDES